MASPESAPPATIVDMIRGQARRTPHRPGVRFEGRSLSYRELDERAWTMACRLREVGLLPEQNVAVCVPNGLDLLPAMLGVMYAGGCLVPVDPEQPGVRLERIAERLAPRALVAPAEIRDRIRVPQAAWVAPHALPSPAPPTPAPLGLALQPEQLAYALVTSGTTGEPKGVLVPHSALASYIVARKERISLLPEDVVSVAVRPSFDAFVGVALWTLASGACVLLPTQEQLADARHWARLVGSGEASVVGLIPSLWTSVAALLHAPVERPPRLLLGGAEAFSSRLHDDLARLFPNSLMHSAYGPTETTVAVAGATAEHLRAKPVSLGLVHRGTTFHLLDAQLEPVPCGKVGEIYVAGAQVARGYLGDPGQTAARFLRGPRLIRERGVFFEGWAIASLADRLAADPAMRPWLVPTVRLEGSRLIAPLEGSSHPLEALDRDVLAACDGSRSVEQIAAALATSLAEVEQALRRFQHRGWVSVGFDGPLELHPERTLRSQLERVSEPAARSRALELLDRLEAAREDVVLAGDDALLALAEHMRAAFEQSDQRLAPEGGPLELLKLHVDAGPDPALLMAGVPAEPIVRAQRELRERWSALLELERFAETRRVRLQSQDLEARAAELFACDGPGWRYSQELSPDIMIAGTEEQIARGDYLVVLGEVHPVNTMTQSGLLSMHPERDQVQRLMDHLCREPRVHHTAIRQHHTQRTNYLMFPAADYHLELAFEVAPAPPQRVLRGADLEVVRDAEGELVVRSRRGDVEIDVVDFYGFILANNAANFFSPIAVDGHAPRITIDDVVISREKWSFAPAAMSFAQEKSTAERFLAAQRFVRAHRLPRRVFVMAPVERKPIYIDLESPISVDQLAKLARASLARGGELKLSEMLPGPEHLWLWDRAGRRYTSEMRILLFDPTPPTYGRRRERA